MKRTVNALAMCAMMFPATAMADPIDELCSKVRSMADTIMSLRQSGVDEATVRRLVDEAVPTGSGDVIQQTSHDVLTVITDSAYMVDIQPEADRKLFVTVFASMAETNCQETFATLR